MLQELSKRIELNFNRLKNDEYYQIGGVFSPAGYDWPGDKEGRALLAFVSHYNINGRKLPCMDEMLNELEARTNGRFYFGELGGEIDEQQLSGHSWLLRGLSAHYDAFRDELSLRAIRSIVEAVYLPTGEKFTSYPIERGENHGGVSGTSTNVINGWRLSSDIGCAFMAIDGLSHAYTLIGSDRLLLLVREMCEVFASIDKMAIKAQTHCSLSAARGMMRMYFRTGDAFYLSCAEDIMALYVSYGMTLTYQNMNWWMRPDSWTEPCAIVDSLMLALELYKATKREDYRHLASRIYINGFASLQRDNGGAGTDTVVRADGKEYLAADMYEAFFCCTMRLAEGLWYIYENISSLHFDEGKLPQKTSDGVYMCGDCIYAEISGGGENFAERVIELDGHKLSPLLKYYRLPKDIIMRTRQRVIF